MKISNRNNRNGRRSHPYKKREDNGNAQGRRVYIGNLSWGVSWQDLKDHMREVGEVTRADIMTGTDGRSKGCGIVEYTSKADAKKAVLTLTDTELDGRKIFVREDREERVSRSGNRSYPDTQGRRVYVGNLSWDVAWQDLKDHMREAGEVSHAEVIKEADGRSKGFGIVEYATSEEAQEAIETLTETELKGRIIYVREDRESNNQGGGGNARGVDSSSTSVYIWNLAYNTSWQDLKDHCRAAGNVDQATILTGSDGRSIGCGVVVYQHPKEAARAIRELQDSELNGRPMYLREDRGKNEKLGSQLFVGNLSFDTSWQDLKDHFRKIGKVEHVEVMEHPDGRKKGFGTVRFSDAEDAENAIDELHGVELQGRELEVRFDSKA
mmetsp:Transcript_22062/g.25136  ORF Transcript_22062/g.25136 Transcript_22062/m.25136 type:complete len:381 (+) Transcript_22062:64-1206(+)|eukprot:CAMPEP_0194145626 /NCGR_PEP_ID=MMETSP0152-20130528/17889_1 /TAXON_ID=1049557 /ORGANISM="Thalassiothrix antarctica, Strain L6-D1" /LENGTH=380 /DNA_ID=CAMNT_0038845907 /DNA_START=64 /DNA_END=1206 /DNA_ORIENTATION=+